MRRLPLLLALLLTALFARATGADGEAQGLRAGLASAPLAPPNEDGDPPAQARAVVFARGSDAVALVALELPLVTAALTEAVESRVKPLGLQGVVLVATGEDVGPVGWSRRPLDLPRLGPPQSGTLEALADAIAAVVREAHNALAPAVLTSELEAVPGRTRQRYPTGEPATAWLHQHFITGSDGQMRGRIVSFAAPLLDLADAAAPPQPLRARRNWPSVLAAHLEATSKGATTLVLRGPAADLEALPPPAHQSGPPSDAAERYAGALALVLEGEMTGILPGAGSGRIFLDRLTPRIATCLPASLLEEGEAPDVARTHPITIMRLRVDQMALTLLPADVSSDAAYWLPPLGWNPVVNAGDHVGTLLDKEAFGTPLAHSDDVLFGPDVWPTIYEALDDEAKHTQIELFREVPGPTVTLGPRACTHEMFFPRDAGSFGSLHGQVRRSDISQFAFAAIQSARNRHNRLVAAENAEVATPGALGPHARAQQALVQRARKLASRLEPRWREEMLGIAEGSGLPYDAILVLNLLVAQNVELPREPGAPPLTQATSVASLGPATSMGQPLHGVITTSGMTGVLFEHTRWVVMEPPGRIPFVAPGWPGVIGVRTGMNAYGLSVSVEEFEPAQEDDEKVVPVAFLVRDVLERAASVEEAEKILSAPSLRTSGARFTLMDGRRLEARVVERRGADVQVRRATDGLLAGCDPDAALDCFLGACDPDVPRCDPVGPRGYPALRAFLEPKHSRLRRGDLEQALVLPEVCVRETLLACVFEPQSLQAYLATDPGQPATPWTRVDLLAALSPGVRARYEPVAPVTAIGDVKVEKKPFSLGGIELSTVELTSAAPSGFASNDTIHGVYYRPQAPKGAVIALPAWKESNLAGQGLLALALAREGYAVLVMPLPYQVDRALEGRGSGEMTFSADLARTRQAWLQGAADVARASLWLEEQGFEPRHQAVMGVSLGGHVAALAYGAYPKRFGAGVFLLAGADASTALLHENRTTGRIRRALLERGVTPEEALSLMGLLDGGTWAKPERARGVLVVGAKQDDVVPPANVRALAAAYGDARLEWLEGDHYGILSQLPKTIGWVVDHLGKALPPR